MCWINISQCPFNISECCATLHTLLNIKMLFIFPITAYGRCCALKHLILQFSIHIPLCHFTHLLKLSRSRPTCRLMGRRSRQRSAIYEEVSVKFKNFYARAKNCWWNLRKKFRRFLKVSKSTISHMWHFHNFDEMNYICRLELLFFGVVIIWKDEHLYLPYCKLQWARLKKIWSKHVSDGWVYLRSIHRLVGRNPSRRITV